MGYAPAHPPPRLLKIEHESPQWQAAIAALLLVAEHGGPTMLARIGRHAGAEPPRRARV
jgi:hypothetical protein